MKVLVVGAGAREHALAWRLAQDGIDALVAPGNGGTPGAVGVQATDIDALVNLARTEHIDLTIVGPEAPLAAGLVNQFVAQRLKVFGPTRAAARLEWSKAWAKDLLRRNGIPTGIAEVVDNEASARQAIARTGLPIVLKADGLAAGKGVFVAHTASEVEDALDHLFRRRSVGSAADHVLIEELLEGPELSVLAFTDGERLAVMPPARDYKRLLDDDRGPNTGGMGGMARPSYATPSLMDDVEQRILKPTLSAMNAEGHPYRGVLYAGLILTADGSKVLEYNCRFGDPEGQLILPLLDSNLGEICSQIASGELRTTDVRWRDRQTFGVVLAAAGYPEAPEVGDPIEGLEAVPDSVHAFHAGTRLEAGRLLTAGGRVMTLVSDDRAAVYAAAETIRFEGKQFRRDIGVDLTSGVGAATG